MPHDVDLIILLAVGFGLALIFGYIAARLRFPPLIGYLIAGIIISPNTPALSVIFIWPINWLNWASCS